MRADNGTQEPHGQSGLTDWDVAQSTATGDVTPPAWIAARQQIPNTDWLVWVSESDVSTGGATDSFCKAGPLGRACIRDLAAGGILDLQTRVWRPGLPEWQTLDTFDELAELLPRSERSPVESTPQQVELAPPKVEESKHEESPAERALDPDEQRLVSVGLLPAELPPLLNPPNQESLRRRGASATYRRLTRYLEFVQQRLPERFPARHDVLLNRALIRIPRRNCPSCSGVGLAGGHSCSCVQEIVIRWDTAPPRGAAVRGTSANGTQSFVRLSGPWLRPLGARSRFGLWTRYEHLWTTGLLLSTCALVGSSWFGWRALRVFINNAMEPKGGWGVAASVTLFCLSCMMILRWASNGVRAIFNLAEPLPKTQAWWALSPGERLRAGLSSIGGLFAIGVGILPLLAAFAYARTANTYDVTRSRGSLLEDLGRQSPAAVMFERLASLVPDSPAASLHRSHARRLWMAIATSDLESGNPVDSFRRLKHILERRDDIRDQDEMTAVGSKLAACTKAMIKNANAEPSDAAWTSAHEALQMLARDFANNPDTIALTQRSNWSFSNVIRVRTVKRLVHFRGNDPNPHYLQPDSNTRLVVVDLQFCHVGNVAKNVPKQAITWKAATGVRLDMLGFETSSGVRTVQDFPESQLGPQAISVSTVWQVPSDLTSFTVSTFGQDRLVLIPSA